MTNIPAKFVAGDTVEWTDSSFGDKTSTNYTLSYAIVGAVKLTVNGVPLADGWTVAITATQSATLSAGDYSWHAYLTSGATRYTVGTGTLTVEENITTKSAGYDGRSQVQQDLDAVEAEIRARASGGMTVEYSIGNRSLKKESISRLLELRSALRSDLVREQRAKRLSEGLGRSIGIRFGR